MFCSGQISCHPCPRGQYSLRNATLCSPCPSGRFQAALQQSTCDACPVGWFANSSGSTRCFTCGSGTFAPTINHTDCQLCPGGTYNINPDGLTPLTSCSPCPGGSYAPNGSSSCTKCPAGRYNNLTFQSECLLCPYQVQVWIHYLPNTASPVYHKPLWLMDDTFPPCWYRVLVVCLLAA